MLIEHLNRQLLELDAAALRRRRRTVLSPCGPSQQLQPGGQLLAFCSNDYLGLASHPELVEALAEGARRWGAGSGASHLVSGHSLAHAELEQELARWLQPHIPAAQALLFCSGFMANLALMTALGDAQTTLLADKLNHASLIDGALLAKARLQRYPHGRLDQLERLLRDCQTPLKLIVTDAVFSMDGDLADLPELLRLAEAYDAWVVIDDAHGFGVLGAQGHGSLEHFGLCSERLIYMGTLGKAAGLSGAFVAAHPTVIEWLLQRARSYIYTTALPPALAHALRASLALIEGPPGQQRRARLQDNVAQLRAGLAALVERQPAWSLAQSPTAIQPLIVGGNDLAMRLSAALEAQGLWVPAIRPPTVPAGTARLRITLSAAHEPAQIQRLLDALAATLESQP
ncbi:MAG: 8-amino-7-oxononanoate synthase [Burkholderiales bacterium]|nr:8-amino-7-oxononanoate synthase [Burkholderiales bacterium]